MNDELHAANVDPPNLTGLAHFVTPAAFQAKNLHIFRSKTSLQWYMRRHRGRLVDAGALVVMAGSLMLDEPKMEAIVAVLGQEEAARGVAS